MKKLIQYVLLTYLITWLAWLPSLLQNLGYNIPQYLLILSNISILGPFLAVLITIWKKEEIKKYFKKIFKTKYNKKYLYPAILIGILLSFLAYILNILILRKDFTLGISLQMLVPVAIIIFITGGPLEELGWRGYALPKLLTKYNAIISSIILGLIHALWHLPLHFIEGKVQYYIPIWEFVVMTVVGSFIYTWLYKKTNGNIIPIMIYHWASNFGSAVFIYWDNTLGRYISLFLLIIISIPAIIDLYKNK